MGWEPRVPKSLQGGLIRQVLLFLVSLLATFKNNTSQPAVQGDLLELGDTLYRARGLPSST